MGRRECERVGEIHALLVPLNRAGGGKVVLDEDRRETEQRMQRGDDRRLIELVEALEHLIDLEQYDSADEAPVVADERLGPCGKGFIVVDQISNQDVRVERDHVGPILGCVTAPCAPSAAAHYPSPRP